MTFAQKDIDNKTDYNPAYKYIINSPLEYNGNKVFFGLNYSVDNSQILFKSSKMRIKFSSIIIFIGLRFL